MTTSSANLSLDAFGLGVRVVAPADIVRELGAIVPRVPAWTTVPVARSVVFQVQVDRST